jgi:hypothetical protein
MTGPELFELGSSIIKDIQDGGVETPWDAATGAALAAACFAGSQAAAFAVMASTEIENDDPGMARAWAKAVGLEVKDESAEDVA